MSLHKSVRLKPVSVHVPASRQNQMALAEFMKQKQFVVSIVGQRNNVVQLYLMVSVLTTRDPRAVIQLFRAQPRFAWSKRNVAVPSLVGNAHITSQKQSAVLTVEQSRPVVKLWLTVAVLFMNQKFHVNKLALSSLVF